MSSRVNLRISEQIRQRAAHVILFELKDPRMGFVTITRVKLAPDFTSCVIFWSVFGSEGDRSKTRHALESSKLYVQRRVAEGLRTRTAPQLSFEYDESVEGAIKMGDLLHKLRDERGDPVLGADGLPLSEGAVAGDPASSSAAPAGDGATGAADDGAADDGATDDGDDEEAAADDAAAGEAAPDEEAPPEVAAPARKKVRPMRKLRVKKPVARKSPRRR